MGGCALCMLQFYIMTLILLHVFLQGPVRFDDYGIREVTKLSVYQFRGIL